MSEPRPNGDRPAFHVPGATRLFTRADVDLERVQDSRALLIGAPDALAGADRRGASGHRRGGQEQRHARRRRRVDTTGCGDGFTAGLLAGQPAVAGRIKEHI